MSKRSYPAWESSSHFGTLGQSGRKFELSDKSVGPPAFAYPLTAFLKFTRSNLVNRRAEKENNGSKFGHNESRSTRFRAISTLNDPFLVSRLGLSLALPLPRIMVELAQFALDTILWAAA